jgi:hypothetical protein
MCWVVFGGAETNNMIDDRMSFSILREVCGEGSIEGRDGRRLYI